MKAPAGQQFFDEMMKKMAATKKEGEGFDIKPEQMSGMMQMMGSFTVLRMTNMLGLTGMSLTKEQLLELNDQLNQIPVVTE